MPHGMGAPMNDQHTWQKWLSWVLLAAAVLLLALVLVGLLLGFRR